MQTLDRRLTALDQASTNDQEIVIIVMFEVPGDLVFNLASDFNVVPCQNWTRRDG